MKKLNRIVSVFVLSGLLISVPTSANPDQEPGGVSNGEAVSEVVERDVPKLNRGVYNEVKKAQSELLKKKFDKGVKRLNKLLARDDLNKYEIANVYNTLGFAYYAQDDHPTSIKMYEKVIEQSPSIPLEFEAGTLYTLGQMNLLGDNPVASYIAFERYLELTDDPGPKAYLNLARAYWQADELEKGKPHWDHLLQMIEEHDLDFDPKGHLDEPMTAAYETFTAP